MSEYLKFATDLAKKSGEIMLKYFDTGDLTIQYKEENQPVTIADTKINKFVIDEVAKVYPGHAVNGEEQNNNVNSDYVWVCDPIDGTIPFMKGIPVSVFSLALVYKGASLLGVVYDPFHNKMYTAEKRAGAFCNGQKMTVSNKNIEDGVINVEWWQGGIRDVILPVHSFATKTNLYPIHIPSAVYASVLVANGAIEANIFPGGRGKNVDIAAVKVIVEEAGGKVTDLNGNEQRYDQDINGAIVSNNINHDKLVEILKVK
jgi:myo-inositol-1(or 4)-monophosphatase